MRAWGGVLCLWVTPGAAAWCLAFLERGALLPVLDLASQAVPLWGRGCQGTWGSHPERASPPEVEGSQDPPGP